MTLYGTCSADSIKEVLDAIKHIHNSLKTYKQILGGSQLYWYKDDIMERRITHLSLNSLYLLELQMKYVNVYKDLIRTLYFCINEIYILFTGYLPISLIPPSQLNDMITLVKKVVTETNPEYDLVTKRLHFYYNMHLVTFGIDSISDLII